MAELIIQKGADVNVVGSKDRVSPLMVASEKGRKKTFLQLSRLLFNVLFTTISGISLLYCMPNHISPSMSYGHLLLWIAITTSKAFNFVISVIRNKSSIQSLFPIISALFWLEKCPSWNGYENLVTHTHLPFLHPFIHRT